MVSWLTGPLAEMRRMLQLLRLPLLRQRPSVDQKAKGKSGPRKSTSFSPSLDSLSTWQTSGAFLIYATRTAEVSQSVSQLVSQSVSQSISQSVNQSISQSVNQSISQSVNQ